MNRDGNSIFNLYRSGPFREDEKKNEIVDFCAAIVESKEIYGLFFVPHFTVPHVCLAATKNDLGTNDRDDFV